MITQLCLLTLLAVGYVNCLNNNSSLNPNSDVMVDFLKPSFGDEPNDFNYPSNPGNPGNYSSQLNMVNYFSNLNTFSPSNKGGSCGFVSLAQVLSYYDTFYNDSIIPEQYDKNLSMSKI